MAGIGRHIAFTLRFLAALFLLACLSPLPDGPGRSAGTFVEMLSRIEGPPSIVIWKSRYSLTLFKGSLPVKTYHAVFGGGYGEGDKERAGDRRTPEGGFYICSMSASKRFYKFLGLSYPDIEHAGRGLRKGMITQPEYDEISRAIRERRQPLWDTRLGGAIGIHGRILAEPTGWDRSTNWTDGCIALANADVDELFSAVSLGTPVTILP